MNDDGLRTPAEIKQFLAGTQTVSLHVSKKERNTFIADTLRRTNYFKLKKPDISIVREYLLYISGCSCAQLTRLISEYKKNKQIGKERSSRQNFPVKYSNNDILLLTKTDKYHQTLSGAATKKLFERAYHVYKDETYTRLKDISVAHIYNLRKGTFYLRQRIDVDKTKRSAVSIGERRKPEPNGEPGYIRIDTVHQGDLDKVKGVYHINAVDEVTQFEVVASVEKISEQFLIPVLEMMLSEFPFKIKGFHSDNGSEYVNKIVLELLNKLHVEFTKSRARKSGDNGLVEGKNGSIIRKVLGHIHIPQKYASQINEFNKQYLNPYINFHRPCFFASDKINKKGKVTKAYEYKNMDTPYDKLKSLPNAEKYLKNGISFERLDNEAFKITDLESAKQLKEARNKLFQAIFVSSS